MAGAGFLHPVRTDTEEEGVTLQGMIAPQFVCPVSVGSCPSEGPELEEFVLHSCLLLILGLFPAFFSWLP